METIKNQVNIDDDELIKKTYEECDKNELKTIIKLLNIKKKDNEIKTNIDISQNQHDIELFRNIMTSKEEFFYRKYRFNSSSNT